MESCSRIMDYSILQNLWFLFEREENDAEKKILDRYLYQLNMNILNLDIWK